MSAASWFVLRRHNRVLETEVEILRRARVNSTGQRRTAVSVGQRMMRGKVALPSSAGSVRVHACTATSTANSVLADERPVDTVPRNHRIESIQPRSSSTANDQPARRAGWRIRAHRLDHPSSRDPNGSAIRAFGTPSAASLQIGAQSCKVTTPQSSSAHFHRRDCLSSRAPPTGEVADRRFEHARRPLASSRSVGAGSPWCDAPPVTTFVTVDGLVTGHLRV